MALLFFGMLFPYEAAVRIGTAQLFIYRFALLGGLIAMVFSKRRIPKALAIDLTVLAYSLWGAVTILIHEELMQAVESGTIFLIETFGAYMLARWAIRRPAQLRALAKFLMGILLLLAALTALEAFTGRQIVRETIAALLGRPLLVGEPRFRLGLMRASGPFPHPILYGVFCATFIGLLWYVWPRASIWQRGMRSGVASLAAFWSLSSGAVAGMVFQYLLVGWDVVAQRIRHRWLILGVGFVAAYIAIDIYSNRSAMEVFLSYATFSSDTAYGRMYIFEYGIKEVFRHPLFGMGLNPDWERPSWIISPSVDNFWLLIAMRHGVLAPLLCWLAVGLMWKRCADAIRRNDPEWSPAAKGLLFSILGLCLAAITVALWEQVYVVFWSLIGMATSIAAAAPEPRRTARSGRSRRPKPAYSGGAAS